MNGTPSVSSSSAPVTSNNFGSVTHSLVGSSIKNMNNSPSNGSSMGPGSSQGPPTSSSSLGGPGPSKRLKLSDSTDSMTGQTSDLLLDLASDLPDELDFSFGDGSYGVATLSGVSATLNSSANNQPINAGNINMNNNMSGGLVSTANNVGGTNTAASHGLGSGQQQFHPQPTNQQMQQPQMNSNGHQQLSQLLQGPHRPQGMAAQPQRMPNNSSLQQQLIGGSPLQSGARANGPGQMRYMGPGQMQTGNRMMMQNAPQSYQMQANQSNNFASPQGIRMVQQQQPNQMRYVNPQMVQGQMASAPNQLQGNVPQQNQMMGPAQPPQQPNQVVGANADPEKRKLIQQQLVLLLHAHKCQRREQQQNSSNCQLPHCSLMKSVLNHMTSCTAGRQCTVAHCASSRQIICHWKACIRTDCPVCLPLKQANDRRAQLIQQQQNRVPNQLVNSLQQPPMAPPSSTTQQPASQPQMMAVQQQQSQQSQISSSDGSISLQGAYQVLGLPYNHNPTSGSPNSMNGPGVQIRPPNSSTPTTGASNAGRLPQTPNQQVNAQLSSGAPGSVANAKDWHATVTHDLRNHLIQKIVQAIFPTPDPNAYKDKRMNNLVAYAEKVERDMYDTANSREEYYHLLAEKIYKIQKELEEKRQKRREQQQMQAQVAGQQGSNGKSPVAMSAPSPMSQFSTGMSINGPGSVGPITGPPSNQNMNSQMMMRSPGPNAMTRMVNSNSIVPPNVNVMSHGPNGQGMPSGVGQSPQQYNFVSPSSSGPQTNQQSMRPSFTSGNLTLQSMLSNSNCANQSTGPMPSPMGVSGLHHPGTPQPGSINNSNPTPPPARPSSVPSSAANNGNSKLQSQLTNSQVKNEGPLNGSTSTPSLSLDSELTLEKLLPVKSEPRDLDDFFGTSSNAVSSTGVGIKLEQSTIDSKSGIKTEIISTGSGVKKEEQLDDADSIITDSASGIVIKDEKESKPSPSTPASVASTSATTSTSSAVSTTARAAATTSTASSSQRGQKKAFKPNELRQALMPTLEKLLRQDPDSLPFRQPVDPTLLQIPDYFEIIKKPMDLSTIKSKLDTGQYQDPWQYVNDVYLMFDNAWTYNRKTSRVYRYCTKLSEIFEAEIDPVMQSLGYCCGRRHVFQPQVLCCFGKQLCTIPRDAKYMNYQNRVTYCLKCFSETPGDSITVESMGLDPTMTGTQTVSKTEFREMKNDHLDHEPLIECNDCGRKLHQVCVCHMEAIWPEGFTCEACLKAKGKKRRDNRFTSKRLPSSKLGTFIENRVNNFLREEKSGAGEVTIRVVSSSEKTVEVKPGMKKRYVDTKEWPETFPYRAKALFAFEDFNGIDVCFFGMHVQEYGSDCSPPNARRVYIAYLDSVHFFKPKQYRTAVYHEILLGYLEYAKKSGYSMAHIWACPPSEGDDYIFHCHPPEQKIPKPKRLQEWYKKMLDIGQKEKIVWSYKDILKQAVEDNVKSAKDLPYFEGDFWPNVIEDSIKEIEMEQGKQGPGEGPSSSANDNSGGNPSGDDESMDVDTASEFGEKSGDIKSESGSTSSSSNSKDSSGNKNQKKSGANKKSNKKQNQRKNNAHQRHRSGGGQLVSSQLTPSQQWEQELTNKIYSTMEKHKEVFFVIRLCSPTAAQSLPPINDVDSLVNCDLMDGRDAFLTLAREKHYEFSSLRRAKFSSMALLFELHNSTNGFVYTCNKCKRHVVETRYHCTVCEDFDLCVSCYKTEGHDHRMEKQGFAELVGDDGSVGGRSGAVDGDGTGDGAAGSSPGDSRRLSIQRCIASLVHACQCRDANCRLPSCHKMKRVVSHSKQCKRRGGVQGAPQAPGCPICKQLIALCCYHAKHCNEAKCTVPYCVNIKLKLKQQQIQQRFQQQAILRRRIANMQNSMSAAINAAATPAEQYSSASAHMKPVVAPPPGALQAVQQVQAAVRQQQQQHPVSGKGGKGAGHGKGGGGKGGGKGGPPMSSGPPQHGKGGGGKGSHMPVGSMNQNPTGMVHSGKGGGGKGASMYGSGKPSQGYPSPVNTSQMRPSMDHGSVMGQGMPQRMQLQHQQTGQMQGPPPQYGAQQPQPGPNGQQWQQGPSQPSQSPVGCRPPFIRMPVQGNSQPGQQLLQQQLMGPNLNQQQQQQQQNQQPLNIPPQMISQMQGSNNQNMQGPPGGSSMSQPGHSNMPPAMQQLLTALQAPTSQTQQENVRQILKSNPTLMAAIIRQRSAASAGQQGGQRIMSSPGQGQNPGQLGGQPGQQQMQQPQMQSPINSGQGAQQQWFNQQGQQVQMQRMPMNSQRQGVPLGQQQMQMSGQPLPQQQRFLTPPTGQQQQQQQQMYQAQQMQGQAQQQQQMPRFWNQNQPGQNPQQQQMQQQRMRSPTRMATPQRISMNQVSMGAGVQGQDPSDMLLFQGQSDFSNQPQQQQQQQVQQQNQQQQMTPQDQLTNLVENL